MSSIKLMLTSFVAVVVGGSILFWTIFETSFFPWSNKASDQLWNLTNKSPLTRSLHTHAEGTEGVTFITNNSKTLILKEDFKTGDIAKSFLQSSFIKRSKELRRRKREIRNQKYVWHFKVNLSRSDVQNTEFPDKENETRSLNSKYEKPNHLGVAVHVEGNGPEDSYQEMHHAWNSVDDFLKRLFKTNANELGHKIISDRTGLVSEQKEDDQKERPEPSHTEEPRLSRDKEGKFLFGFLGFGGNSENPPMDQGSGEDSKQMDSTLETRNTDIQLTTIFNIEQSVPNSTTVLPKEEREGKLFLGFLGFEGNSENPSMDQGSGEEFDQLNSTFETGHDIQSTIFFSPEQTKPTSTVITEKMVIPNTTATTVVTDTTQMLNKDRKGKFFLGFLGFGGNGENPPMEQGSGEIFEQLNSTSETENFHEAPSTTIFSSETPETSSTAAITKNATELPIIESDFVEQPAVILSTEFLAENSMHTEDMATTQFFPAKEKFVEIKESKSTTEREFGIKDPTLIEPTALDRIIDSSTELDTPNETEKNKQFEQSAGKTSDSELEPDGNKSNSTKSIGTKFEMQTIPSTFFEMNESNSNMEENTLTAEDIKEFCVSLFSRKETPKFSIEFSDSEGSGVIVLEENKISSTNTPFHNQILKELRENQSPQSLGFFANVIRGSNKPNKEWKSNEVLQPNDSLEELAQQDAKIFNNLFPNFGSGRSAELDEIDASENEDSNKTLNTNIQNVADCENFFRSIEMKSATSASDAFINRSPTGKYENENANAQTEELSHIEHTTVKLVVKEKFLNEFGLESGFSELLEETRMNKSFTEGGMEGLMGEDFLNEGTDANLFAWNVTKDSRFISGLWNLAQGSGETAKDINELSNVDDQRTTSYESTEYSTKEMYTMGDVTMPGRIEIETPEISSHEEEIFANTFHLEDDIFTISTLSNKNRFLESGSDDTRDVPEVIGKEQSSICVDCQTTNFTDSTTLPTLGLPSKDVGGSEETTENDTGSNQPKLIGSLFLSGSGDGAPINLVQETNISSPIVPAFGRRGKVLDDIPDNWQEESLDFSRRRGRFENNSEASSGPSIDLSTKPKILVDEFNENIDSEGIKFSTEELSSISHLDEHAVHTEFIPATITNELTSTLEHQMTNKSERICSNNSVCEKSLNERCITGGTKAICGCGKSFVRHPESGKCETPVLLKTSMKLPGEVFHNDLKNETSELFLKKQKEAIDALYTLLSHDPKLLSNIAKIEVTFEEGSLIANYKIVYATEGKENVSELVEQVDADIRNALKDEELLSKVSLNVTQADVSVASVDQCKTSENYCSRDADCIVDEFRGFRCQCKDGFLDNSRDKVYAGETCIATCPPSYCGENGFCDLRENGERHCLCSGFYFGSRCQLSGIVLIGGFAALNVLLVITVVVMVCFCKNRRHARMSGHYGEESQPHRDQDVASPTTSERVTDALALDTMGPSKYVTISTPMPTIKITEPSLPRSVMGSETSYDLDSTFDRTQSSGDANQIEKL